MLGAKYCMYWYAWLSIECALAGWLAGGGDYSPRSGSYFQDNLFTRHPEDSAEIHRSLNHSEISCSVTFSTGHQAYEHEASSADTWEHGYIHDLPRRGTHTPTATAYQAPRLLKTISTR